MASDSHLSRHAPSENFTRSHHLPVIRGSGLGRDSFATLRIILTSEAKSNATLSSRFKTQTQSCVCSRCCGSSFADAKSGLLFRSRWWAAPSVEQVQPLRQDGACLRTRKVWTESASMSFELPRGFKPVENRRSPQLRRQNRCLGPDGAKPKFWRTKNRCKPVTGWWLPDGPRWLSG